MIYYIQRYKDLQCNTRQSWYDFSSSRQIAFYRFDVQNSHYKEMPTLGQIEETWGQNGRTEESQENRATDQSIRTFCFPVTMAMTPKACKHLTQLTAT
jgi:hypothetical protein